MHQNALTDVSVLKIYLQQYPEYKGLSLPGPPEARPVIVLGPQHTTNVGCLRASMLYIQCLKRLVSEVACYDSLTHSMSIDPRYINLTDYNTECMANLPKNYLINDHLWNNCTALVNKTNANNADSVGASCMHIQVTCVDADSVGASVGSESLTVYGHKPNFACLCWQFCPHSFFLRS